jgi:hypothetical protein
MPSPGGEKSIADRKRLRQLQREIWRFFTRPIILSPFVYSDLVEVK